VPTPAEHYNRVTEAWSLLLGDELHYGVFESTAEPLADATSRLTRLMIDALDPEPGSSVLDVGCGSGTPALKLARERGVRVTGISTSSAGIATANRRAASAGLDELVDFQLRDAMDNGFRDSSFDCAWALESSHLMPRRNRFVAETARVLRPGGRVALCDIVLRRKLDLAAVRGLMKPLAVLRDVFGEARMEPVSEYRHLFEASGLEITSESDLTEPTRPTFAGWRANAMRERASVTAALGDEYWSRFVEATSVLEGFWEDGTLGYALLVAEKR
jgi:cyclopropane fatty-acyl-phospholipid synthase-like methyltransferase